MINRRSLYIAMIMISTGCVETISLDSQEKNLPVTVNCILIGENRAYEMWDNTPEPQTQSLTIRFVKGKAEKNYTPVEDAVVYMKFASESFEEETLLFSYVEDGRWESERPIVIEPETAYSLYVEIPGRETICAQTVSPPRVYLGVNPSERINYDMKEYYLHNFKFQASRGQADNPGGGIGLKGYAVWIYAQEYSPEGWIDLDYLVTNNPYADDFNTNHLKFSDLEVSGKSTNAFDSFIFDSFEGAKNLAPNLPLHKKFVRIYNLESDDYWFVRGGPMWYPNVEYNEYSGRSLSDYFRCQCHFLSKDLDEYLRNVYVHDYSLDNYLTTLYSSSNVFSNINGGIGIFGCDSVSMINLLFPGGSPNQQK